MEPEINLLEKETSSKPPFLGSMFVFGPVAGYSYKPGGFHETSHGPLSWIQVRCFSFCLTETSKAFGKIWENDGKLHSMLHLFLGVFEY